MPLAFWGAFFSHLCQSGSEKKSLGKELFLEFSYEMLSSEIYEKETIHSIAVMGMLFALGLAFKTPYTLKPKTHTRSHFDVAS